MVAICGPMGTHRSPCSSNMRRELYAALHCNLHFIDSKYSLQLKEDDSELDLDLAQLPAEENSPMKSFGQTMVGYMYL